MERIAKGFFEDWNNSIWV